MANVAGAGFRRPRRAQALAPEKGAQEPLALYVVPGEEFLPLGSPRVSRSGSMTGWSTTTCCRRPSASASSTAAASSSCPEAVADDGMLDLSLIPPGAFLAPAVPLPLPLQRGASTASAHLAGARQPHPHRVFARGVGGDRRRAAGTYALWSFRCSIRPSGSSWGASFCERATLEDRPISGRPAITPRNRWCSCSQRCYNLD